MRTGRDILPTLQRQHPQPARRGQHITLYACLSFRKRPGDAQAHANDASSLFVCVLLTRIHAEK